MKNLRTLINENRTKPLPINLPTNFLTAEVGNCVLFSKFELKTYFNSKKFLEDLLKCLKSFNITENKGLFPLLILKGNGEEMYLTLDFFDDDSD